VPGEVWVNLASVWSDCSIAGLYPSSHRIRPPFFFAMPSIISKTCLLKHVNFCVTT
jgi:hypothetical protein